MSHSWSQRLLAHSSERVMWLKARSRGITATDAARLTSAKSCFQVAKSKAYGTGFGGNVYTEHGRRREPVIADWVLTNFGINHSDGLYRSPNEQRHLATPDGIDERCNDDDLILAEIKTSNKPLTAMPKTYRRQILWQQYVMGAKRTLLVWEQHEHFVPIGTPKTLWIERDDEAIEQLVRLADETLSILDELPEDPFFAGR